MYAGIPKSLFNGDFIFAAILYQMRCYGWLVKQIEVRGVRHVFFFFSKLVELIFGFVCPFYRLTFYQ